MVKNLPASAGDLRDSGLIPGLVRSSGEGNNNPLQYSCLENAMDRGAWWAAVHGVAESWTRLSDLAWARWCVCSVGSDSLRPHALWPARLLSPWDFPGKNTGVGCHFLLRGSSQPRDWTHNSYVFCIAGRFFIPLSHPESPFSTLHTLKKLEGTIIGPYWNERVNGRQKQMHFIFLLGREIWLNQ